ncbi:MAG: type II secretion system protein [Gammaproteobacteria bacterium]
MRAISLKHGFTLIELVVTIIVLGIIAAYVVPRLNLLSIQNQGYFDLAKSTIRYGQKRAIATGCIVNININTAACNLSWVGCAGNSSITNPATNNNNFCLDSTPEGSVSNGVFRFDPIGRPMNTGNTVLVSAQDISVGTRTIRVEAQTGFVHEP